MNEKSEIDLLDQLQKVRNEMAFLYEISNAMHTTLKLDEILYIILTAVTAHAGLGFNRAMLFLVNEKDGVLEGKMGIGPDTGEEANRIWTHIEISRMGLDDLLNNYNTSSPLTKNQFNNFVKTMAISLREEKGGVLAMTLLDGMPLHFKPGTMNDKKPDALINALQTNEFVTVPLKAKDKIIGVLFVDNRYTNKPINSDDIRILTMFANQAGLAIENSRLYEQTLTQSHTDSLTNLWNHGYFQHLLRENIYLCEKEKQPLSIIMADLDNFKAINDLLGHQEGDQILFKTAEILKVSARKQDFVCRYGGEEFAILLPKTNKMETLIIAERLRQQIEKFNFSFKNNQPDKHLTIALGVSEFPEDALIKDSLLACGDQALYEAKRKGKNCVIGFAMQKFET